MAIATSNSVSIHLVPEISFGTEVIAPEFEPIRFTGESLISEYDHQVSEEIRADRARSDTVRVGSSVSGDIEFELSMKSFDSILQAVLCGTWPLPVGDISKLKNGVEKRSFVIQKRFNDLTPLMYHNFYGVRFDSLQLNIEPADIIEASVTVVGKNSLMTENQYVSSTDKSAISTSPLNSSINVQYIDDNGMMSNHVYHSINIQIANNLRALYAIGNLGPIDINYGVMDISGEMDIYFKDATMYSRFVNDSAFSMFILLQAANGDYFKLKLPRIKFESAEITAGGLDQDLTINASWRAMFDVISQCQIEIEKYVQGSSSPSVEVWDETWDEVWV